MKLFIANNLENKYIEKIEYIKKIPKHCSYVSVLLSGSESSSFLRKSALDDGYILFSGSLEMYLSNSGGGNNQSFLDVIYAVLINAKQCAPKIGAVQDIAKQENSFVIIKKDGTEVFIFNTPQFSRLVYIQGDM